MDENLNICIIGEVCVDLTLTDIKIENKLRFGGIVHPSRALWALNVPYSFYYCGPEYFSNQINKFMLDLSAKEIQKIGNVKGSPNVILIAEPKEIGPQGYEYILRDEYENTLDIKVLSALLKEDKFSDIVIFAGKFPLSPIVDLCRQTGAKIHIDLGNARGTPKDIINPLRKVETIFLSTSSEIFLHEFEGSIDEVRSEILTNYARQFVFKENRGGCRLYNDSNLQNTIQVGAQFRPIVHSVGVGDCFDIAYILFKKGYSDEIALSYAAWIAAEYAMTTFPNDFKRGCDRVRQISSTEIVSLSSIYLPWEKRPDYSIYIAAPDFDYKDRSLIDKIVNNLKYHNFKPRLPIRENGQLGVEASEERKEQLFIADLALLEESKLILAILLDNDPGTLIEIGFAKAIGKSVIVYDPYRQAQNLMLTQIPDLISPDLDIITSKIFELLSKEE